MLVAILLATLIALFAASVALLIQGLVARQRRALSSHRDRIYRLAQTHGGIVTAELVAKSLSLSDSQADGLLRRLVDDESFTMGVDDKRGVLQFWFPDLVEAGPSLPPGPRGLIQRKSQLPAAPDPRVG